MASRSTPLTGEKAEALQTMDVQKILRAYIHTAITSASGYKALLLDKETMKTCSTMYGRSELADLGVVHVERIDMPEQHTPHLELKAIVFIRPSRDNITSLKRELKAPRFQQMLLYFTNLLSPIYLQELAEADATKEQVAEVQELYGDFSVQDSQHFTISCARNDIFLAPKAAATAMSSTLEYELVDRCVQGLSALFLALRRRPIIRYQQGSDHAQRLADSLHSLTFKQQYQLFDFGSRSTPVVLILDRRDDPVTPLLMQWSYQAMIHELIGIHDSTCKLTSAKVDEDNRELVLDAKTDEFYRKHQHLNFGEVGLSVKALMEHYQTTESKHKQVESLEDMRRFMTEHIDFTRLQGNVTKHVNLMSELSETVGKRNLLEVSETEQELANPTTAVTSASSYEDVMRLLRQISVADKDKIRLVMLYALRFEEDTIRVQQLKDFLVTAGVRDREPVCYAAIDAVLRTAGLSQRAGDLYATRSIVNKARTIFQGLKGVDNVYTQHTPLLSATLTNLSTDKLDVAAYPFMASTQDEAMAYQATYKRAPPREAILFIVGGSTFEEAKAVSDWNDRNPQMRVILGGTAVLNSGAFLQALGGGGPSTSGENGHTAVEIR